MMTPKRDRNLDWARWMREGCLMARWSSPREGVVVRVLEMPLDQVGES
jgi:hypothetical protein